MKINVYNMEGKVVSEKELAPALFNVKINEGLIHLAVETASANGRTSNQHTKTKGEVRGGGKKPWKQKGTGRARAGSTRSPIWVGGGITFGPTPDRNYEKKINKKTKKVVVAMVLSDKAKHDAIVALDAFSAPAGKTKALSAALSKLPLKRNVLIVLPKSDAMVIRASRNLQKVKTVSAADVSLTDLLKADSIIMPVATIEAWESKYKAK